MADFEKLRISLARKEQGLLLKQTQHVERHRSRREFLEAAFKNATPFLHSRTGKRFDFIPLPIDGDYAAGIFRRKSPVPLKQATLEPYDAENYEGAVFIISLSKDQIAWMQSNPKLGSPKPIIESFFDYLSKKSDISDWKVFIKNFESESEYFNVIRSMRSQIAEISFTFIPPNALSAEDEVYKFVKTLQLEAHPEIQKHVYRAEPGQMNPDTDHMNASARIAMAGGGDAEVRDKKRRLLYGKVKGKVVREVPDTDLPTPAHTSFIKNVLNRLFGDED